MTADEIIAALDLEPHPEGGWYRETFRDRAGGERGHSTAIYFLLRARETSHWHRVTDAVEIWHYHAGAPLELRLSDGQGIEVHRLGPDVLHGERPQRVVPANSWQSAASLGDWTLVGCTVAPGFSFAAFELAPAGWAPGA
jgi:predicted cupin superfamily sugar epimerase